MSSGQARRVARYGVGVMAIGALAFAAPAMGQDPAVPPVTPPVVPAVPVDPAAPVVPAPPARGIIAPGVSIAGVDVSGLSASAARAAVIAGHIAPRRAPLVVVYRNKRVAVKPVAVGYAADIAYSVKVALLYGRTKSVPAEGVDVPLRERVNLTKIRAVLRARVARFDVAPQDAAFTLRGTTPVARDARSGMALDQAKALPLVRDAILEREANIVRLPSMRTTPSVTRLPSVIIVDRGNFRLTLWRHKGRSETFPIAVGTSSHPTPTGNYSVIQKQVNPTWFPPNSPWAAGLGPVAPGPSNPLGTRWIGTSAPAIGMHGTPAPSSIGTRASHGCIRMYMRDVERLYNLVDIGTPVYIR